MHCIHYSIIHVPVHVHVCVMTFTKNSKVISHRGAEFLEGIHVQYIQILSSFFLPFTLSLSLSLSLSPIHTTFICHITELHVPSSVFTQLEVLLLLHILNVWQ